MEAGVLISDRYRLVRSIGAGGMGEVWEATHAVTRKRVAVKVLNSKYAQHPSVRARFLLEARAACRVRHPNVVQVHDVVELADGAPAMVMDLLQGESLCAKLERESVIGIGPLAAILAPVVDAMIAAHALGIVHRDLKPDNLFIEQLAHGETTVKILDFGIAKVAPADDERGSPALTSTGAVLGTPYYMSPEQAYGEKDLDYRSDVWSLGIILYECLTGRRPTEADNFGQILKTITTGSIPPLANVAPQIPRDVADLVTRMLKCARAERPQLAEVLEVLRRHARTASSVRVIPRDHDSSKNDLTTQAELDETAPALATAEAPAVAPLAPPRKARSLRWAAVAACVLALGGAGLMRARGSATLGPSSAANVQRPIPASAPQALPVAEPPISEAPQLPELPVAPLSAAAAAPEKSATAAITRPTLPPAKKPLPAAVAAPVAPVPPSAPQPGAGPAKSESVGKLFEDKPF